MPKKKETEQKPENKGTEIVISPISEEMKKSYLDYAMSVITQRALPDVRDGLKPVHRRILFSLYKNGLTHSSKFKKSATVVGDVIGNYHPHGDASVYDAMVKLAQPFGSRYMLVQGQGNFGSIDGDPPAAYRYTEARMAKISSEILFDIEKDTVDFRPNFDGSKKEPIVMPTKVPGLLLNGTLGIAVGMASNIPPHNLNEVIDATTHLIENPKANNDDLNQFVKGPDFPMGGLIFDEKDIKHAYANGRGGVVCRGETDIIEEKSGSFQIVISSIPFRVNKADLISKIADLVKDKKIEGIKDIRDESTDDIRVVIDLKNNAHPQKVLNYIYKHTSLEDTFHFNMVALVDGVPQTLNLKSILEEFVAHRFEVVTRRTKFDLMKAEAREHILIGLKKALDHIDEIIKVIKASKDTPTAHANLMKKFKFSELQATAILEMRLQKLAGLERKKIEDELKEIQNLIKELKALLASKVKMKNVIKKELEEIKEKFGDERRTKVIPHGVKNISVEDLIPEEPTVLVLSKGGYIKRTNPNEYKGRRFCRALFAHFNTCRSSIFY
jgi:DNA gyrase subunit A